MITVKLQGGLGNQLFQYALGRRLQADGKDVVYDIESGYAGQKLRIYNLGHYNVHVDIAPQSEIEKGQKEEYKKKTYGFISKSMRFLKSKGILKTDGVVSKISNRIKSKLPITYNIGYLPHVLQMTDGYLDGFWQSYKYLDPIRDILLKEISLKEPIENTYSETVKSILMTNSVALHVRRGDYVHDPTTKQAHYTFGIEYYEKALPIIKEKVLSPTLFVFSDDIAWARENIKTDMPIVFVSKPAIKDYEELILMSLCKHDIIANSSFSFWAAWLNQNKSKVVIAPLRWDNAYEKEHADLIPPSWIRL
jgi:hypothetical protein